MLDHSVNKFLKMAGDDRNGVLHRPPAELVVVMVPFVAHGHLNQLLYLSRLITSYNIPVHFTCTTTHLRQLRRRLHSSGQLSGLIHFHEFSTPPFNSPPPDPSNPFPNHLQPAFDSTLHLRRPVGDLILSLSNTAGRVAVVHDFLMSYVVQDVKRIPNAETYIFHPLSAIHTFMSTWENLGRPFRVDPDIVNRIPSEDGSFSPKFLEFMKLQEPHLGFNVGGLIDSSRAIEGEFIEYMERKEMYGKKKLWAIGPFNPTEKPLATPSKSRHKCLRWLDRQPLNSVVYISFGTITAFSDEQTKELAIGLDRSQQRFLWVAQVEMLGENAKMVKLPTGFEERVQGRGLMVWEWAPQMEILGHLATGGFMSHCGWNSSMESMSMGVPMLTWPMHFDQPRNAFLITDVLRVGLAVKDWARRGELVRSEVVEEGVRKLMDSGEGEEMRRRAVGLSGAIRRSMGEGGVCRKEIDSFISYITRPITKFRKPSL